MGRLKINKYGTDNIKTRKKTLKKLKNHQANNI